MSRFLAPLALLLAPVLVSANTPGTITFENYSPGESVIGFDVNGDGAEDIIFSINDAAGFNAVGPGLKQNWVAEPLLEGAAGLAGGVRVDFPFGAVENVGFGFAITPGESGVDPAVVVQLFDEQQQLIATGSAIAGYSPMADGQSSFPEGRFELDFQGVAAYATIDFQSAQAGRFSIDAFSATFGDQVPQAPAPVLVPTLSHLGLALLAALLLLMALSFNPGFKGFRA